MEFLGILCRCFAICLFLHFYTSSRRKLTITSCVEEAVRSYPASGTDISEHQGLISFMWHFHYSPYFTYHFTISLGRDSSVICKFLIFPCHSSFQKCKLPRHLISDFVIDYRVIIHSYFPKTIFITINE